MLSYLPCDLVDEILSRIPTKSLIRLRSTCKRWNSLFDDHIFSKKHFVSAIKESMFLLFINVRLFTISCELQRLDGYNVNLRKLSLRKCICKNKNCKIYEVLHCDGLLLALTQCFELIVWNPCLKETKLIEPHIDRLHIPTPGYAIGCDKKYGDRRYKILFFGSNRHRCPTREFFVKYSKVEIILEAKIDFFLSFPTHWISLKGNSYWVGADENTNECFIVRFDFSTEMFGRLSLPFLANLYSSCLSMSVKNDRISILQQKWNPYYVEIWMTGTVIDGQELSWSKLMRVEEETIVLRFRNPYFYIHDEEKKVVVFCYRERWKKERVCIMEDQKYTEVYVEEVEDIISPIIYNYVPTLDHIR
ncbi:hypothetical protein CARUB_v10011211mg [Capsella rubella]|uniref:F-box domain-containing protein n=1 Tax=Capsella rubella TaxID=81985 RepID=R0GKR2_9BRAS|nr:hypothetical protein CARUB_v10011211mg [Capsella rubella]